MELLVGGTVANGGTWQPVDATWDTPYNSDFGNDGTSTENRIYTITPDYSSQVWGMRLIGQSLDYWINSQNEGKYSSDQDGYIAVNELQVTGDVTFTDNINLATNLAAGQTAIWAGGAENVDNNEWVTDEFYDDNYDQKNHYVHNAGYDSPDDTEFLGIMFDSAQANVNAVGACMKKYYSTTYGGTYGGLLTPESIDVEYTIDAGTTWASVTNLDTGRYSDDFADILDIPWGFAYVGLFTFDTIGQAVDGIRIIGTPYANAEYTNDPDGFLATSEIEVFAAAGTTPPIAGDANKDGKVDGSDVTILANNWQAGVSGGGASVTWEMGDFNGDHKVDGSDVTILANNWQYGVTAAAAAVPEPSMIILLLGAIGTLLMIRRK